MNTYICIIIVLLSINVHVHDIVHVRYMHYTCMAAHIHVIIHVWKHISVTVCASTSVAMGTTAVTRTIINYPTFSEKAYKSAYVASELKSN